MKIRISKIVSRIFNLLDENETICEELVEYGDPGAMLRSLITDLLPDAARVVITSAPLHKIDDCRQLTKIPVRTDGQSRTVILPEDFLRLVYLRMSDWNCGVSVPLQYGGEEYHLRMGAGKERTRRTSPAAAVACRGAERTLEIFGTGEDSEVIRFDYVPVPEISDAYINLPPALISDVCLKTAEMVGAVIEK